MISFIIPTVYKAPQLSKLIQNLEDCELVTEIILYENAPNNGMLDNISSDKLIIKKYTKNDFCNKAWNYGAENSKNYYYALCNDDILFPTSIIDDVLHFYKLRPKSGFIGMHKTQFDTVCKPNVYGFIEREVWYMDGGWGSLIFNHKDNNVIIPSELKQWCGDTYFLYYSKYPCYNYFGEKFYTNYQNHSTSTDNKLINTVCVQDCKIFEEKYKLEKPIWA
jgi:hypothetical protein